MRNGDPRLETPFVMYILSRKHSSKSNSASSSSSQRAGKGQLPALGRKEGSGLGLALLRLVGSHNPLKLCGFPKFHRASSCLSWPP